MKSVLRCTANQGYSGTTTAGDVAALDAFAAANGLPLPTSSVPEPASAVMMGMERGQWKSTESFHRRLYPNFFDLLRKSRIFLPLKS